MDNSRKLSLMDCVSILFNVIIGSGIFYLGSLVLINVGFSLGWSLICWVLGGVVSLLSVFIYAELGTSIKDEKGLSTAVVYMDKAFHPFFGYVSIILNVFITSPAATASFALAFATAYKTAFGLSDIGVKIMALALTAIVGLLNLRDAKSNANTAKITTVLKFIPILFILCGGLFLGGVKPDLSLVASEVGSGTITIGMIALGVNASLWAYSGGTLVIPLSNSMKDPAKDIPRSAILSTALVTLLYTVFTYALYRVLPLSEMQSMIASGDLYIGTAAAKSLFSFGGILVTVCIMISVFGSFNSSMLSAARSQEILGRTGHFPEVFAKENKNGVPIGPICTQVGIGALFIIFSGLSGLTSINIFIGNLTNVLVVLCVPIFRKKYPDIERPYKIPMYWFTIIAYGLIQVVLLVSGAIGDPSTILLAGAGILFAAIFWFIFKPKKEKN